MPSFFVYGALMLHPRALASGVAACVDEHAIRFVVRGLPLLEPAFAALEAEAGARAWGVIAEFSDVEWATVRRRERPYLERPVVARTLAGVQVAARALFPSRRPGRAEGAPSARYADLLLRGAERFALPAEIVERYRALRDGGPRATLALVDALARWGVRPRPF